MSDHKYVSSKIAQARLGVCNKTLKNWAVSGKIDFITTNGGWRRYNLDKYLVHSNMAPKKKICYCRVSSYEQKQDLERQIQYLSTQYPNHEIIKDIGSGINFKRPGLRKLIQIAIKGELEELVLTYKDRLCRIGFEMLEFIFTEYSNTRIIIENEENQNQQEKITEDLIQIITVYSSKLYGSRSSKTPKSS